MAIATEFARGQYGFREARYGTLPCLKLCRRCLKRLLPYMFAARLLYRATVCTGWGYAVVPDV